jgi:hypothetical protein
MVYLCHESNELIGGDARGSSLSSNGGVAESSAIVHKPWSNCQWTFFYKVSPFFGSLLN